MLRCAPCVQNPGGLRVYFAVAPHGLIHPGDSRHYLGLARRNIRPLRVALDLILITGTAECLVALTVSDNAAVPHPLARQARLSAAARVPHVASLCCRTSEPAATGSAGSHSSRTGT